MAKAKGAVMTRVTSRKEDVMKVLLQRSHFNLLVVGAANVHPVEDWFVETSQTGWRTNFDGGGNVHNPNEFGVVFLATGSAPDGQDEPVSEAVVMRVHERWAQNNNDKSWTRFYRHRRPEQLCGQEVFAEGFFYAPRCDTYLHSVFTCPQDNKEAWELIPEEAISKEALHALKWAMDKLQSLHGQGGEPFAA